MMLSAGWRAPVILPTTLRLWICVCASAKSEEKVAPGSSTGRNAALRALFFSASKSRPALRKIPTAAS
jgi:hypothetical protein